jgi:hypothetical protein
MKLLTCKFRIFIIFSLIYFISLSINTQGQIPPPPPPNGGPNNGHGLGGNQGATNAPIGGGTGIILILGALYAGKKAFHNGAAKEE